MGKLCSFIILSQDSFELGASQILALSDLLLRRHLELILRLFSLLFLREKKKIYSRLSGVSWIQTLELQIKVLLKMKTRNILVGEFVTVRTGRQVVIGATEFAKVPKCDKLLVEDLPMF